MTGPQDSTFARLTAHLWRGGTFGNWFTSTPQPNDKERKQTIWFEVGRPRPYPTGKTNAWFGLAPLRQIPPTNAKGEPTKPAHVRSQLAYVEAVNCLFAEYDRKDYPDGALGHIVGLEYPPSVLVESSPGSFHAYWLLADTFRLDSPADLERAKSAQAGWVNAVGGDAGAKDLTRVLRIPGTLNIKPKYAPDYPTVKTIYAHFDRLYTFEELEAIALPALTAAEQNRAARTRSGQAPHVVDFGEPTQPPDLSDLPPELAAKLDDPGAIGERSKRDYGIICGLIAHGLSDAAIKAIFDHYPIGQMGKYAERGADYLGRTIAKARGATPDPRLGTGIPVADLLNAARKWVYSADCIEYLREKGIRNPAAAQKVLAGLVLSAREYYAITFMPGTRKIAENSGTDRRSVGRQLPKLSTCDVIGWVKTPAGYQATLHFVTTLVPSLMQSAPGSLDTVNTGALCISEEWHEAHLQNDLYTSVAYRHGIKRRTADTVLLLSLGPAALHVERILRERPEATVQEIAELTGLSPDTVRRVLRKMHSAGLVYVARCEGKQHVKVWALVEDADERAAAILPETTGYGTGVRNAELSDRLQATWLDEQAQQAEQEHRSGTDSPDLARRIARLKEKEAAARRRSDARVSQLAMMGIKPIKHYGPKPFMRYDLAEQEQEHAEALLAWFDLADLPDAERTRTLHLAGWTDADIQAAVRFARRRPMLMTQEYGELTA